MHDPVFDCIELHDYSNQNELKMSTQGDDLLSADTQLQALQQRHGRGSVGGTDRAGNVTQIYLESDYRIGAGK